MEKPRRLEEFSSAEMVEFLDSFDTIMTDCDGVLWLGHSQIEGSFETLKKLQSLGKKIIFVSNNGTQTTLELSEKLRKMGFAARPEQIAIPSSVICWYLKKRGFNGKAFVLGMSALRQVLTEGGIDVSEPGPDKLEEELDSVLRFFRSASKADAVIVDFDLNMNWAKMMRAIDYLKKSEILYLTGALDRSVPISETRSILGMADFVETISKESNRTSVNCAKPSEAMRDYVIETFNIFDPTRCIFVGDSLDSDMKFADLCGFSKLWVGSGVHTLEQANSRQRFTAESHSSLPFYYLPCLGSLKPLLDKAGSPNRGC